MNQHKVCAIFLIVNILLMIYLIIELHNPYEMFNANNNEAIQNIASLYNSREGTFTNLNVTNNAKFKNLTVNETSKFADIDAQDITGMNIVADRLTASQIAPNENVIIGFSAQAKCAAPKPPGTIVGKHTDLYNKKDICYQMCPKNYVMVGLYAGREYDHKHPLCVKLTS